MQKKTSSIKDLKDTKVNKLSLRISGKLHVIDLSKELSISETRVNSMLMENPSSYSLLCNLRTQAIAKRDILEKDKDLVFSKVYVNVIESNPKATKELANHKANMSTKYQVAYGEYLAAKEYAESIVSICRAFEMRAQLLQTVSSNIRRE